MAEQRKVLLIDGHSLAYRAFYALPETMTTADGQPTNAVFGFTSMLLKVIDEKKPDAVIVAFDISRKDLKRTHEYPEYKAHRPPMPDELGTQISMIGELLEHMRIPAVRAQGHEADDVLGTLADEVAGRGDEAIIVTGDRDTLQLVRDGVTVLMTGKGITETREYDRGAVQEEYGVPPEKLPEIAGLKGDSSDNIPGVPGIGIKGASALIGKYGSLENLYDHLEEITGPKRKLSLEENREQAFLSRRLATIEKAVPVRLDVGEVELETWDADEVLEYLSSLQFKRLARKFAMMYGEESGPHVRGSGEELPYTAVPGDRKSLKEFLSGARDAGEVAVAISLSGEGYCDLRLEGAAIATGNAVLVAAGSDDEPAMDVVGDILRSPEIEKWFHGAKEALEALDKKKMTVRGVAFDTKVAAYLKNPSLGKYALEDIWERNVGATVLVDGESVRVREQESLLAPDEGEERLRLASEAARIFNLKRVIERDITDLGMARLFRDIEMPLILVLKGMEETGVALDAEVVERLADEAGLALVELKEDIHRLAGHEFNVSSTRQLGRVLFEEMGIPPVRKTKAGFSTDSTVLRSLKDEWEIAGKVIAFRENAKLKSTYYDTLPRLVCPESGRIHCSFNQTATSTGRISSSNPNLQNIPVRTDDGRRIRKAFVPGGPGWKMLVADYSQIELRVLAHMSGDERMIGAFASGADIHRQTAAEIFGVEEGDVTDDMRRKAKVVNFGIIYGMGRYGLSSRMGISVERATEYIEAYFIRYDGVREYRERCVAEAEEKGYAETLLGRRRLLPELASPKRHTRELGERLAVNTPIQGTAADIIKKAMNDVASAMGEDGFQSRMIMQIHDELVFDVAPGEGDELSTLVVGLMAGVLDLRVALKVEAGLFDNWGQAKYPAS
ncbi:MAG: DNA polymerase I [Actinobacteria bacterium]|nr:DNA polymerase I [Actinomycetota bacterium]MCG2819137.1 DNA polymerase I [Actinomycetes bacterium]MBU4179542.1 DNA polymerase I [Actinomycetota bacterium]MBU4219006.1 DNA polymerase I [Actinomycetota bacterium]MBU4359194.1 DNA polymerase I [Actinomycetota bacterium]